MLNMLRMPPFMACATIGLAFAICAGRLAAQQIDSSESDRQAREQYSHLASDPKRDPWQKPDQVVSALNFLPTDVVAVVGDEDGYLARHIVGRGTTAYLISWDARESLHAQKEKPPGLQIVNSSFGNLPALSVQFDKIVIYDVVDQLADRASFYLKLLGQLKPSGKIIIIGNNPPSGLPTKSIVSSPSVVTDLRVLGLKPLPQPLALPFQYFLVFSL
jgi:hypothetical protein